MFIQIVSVVLVTLVTLCLTPSASVLIHSLAMRGIMIIHVRIICYISVIDIFKLINGLLLFKQTRMGAGSKDVFKYHLALNPWLVVVLAMVVMVMMMTVLFLYFCVENGDVSFMQHLIAFHDLSCRKRPALDSCSI